ncbi:2-succinyl-5-enolpyruvyl-6-hydroxy-3-cyclohexene-1-carboxylic-acid synthase [Limnoraphis robusta]|uniref:2-succinyl-5-enolpyruvyl-6-hydroxy-3- cyclohexene-1-carboxylic-acid synthase n=1 Tax=Limnoraphis robusta TaxID=1118279 RepID=UPI002B1F4207|nr:2-succinyl-5-enolpyruvyl-6-hydroxy-3-cyclohexene-1-carboxylic-acid synthase [Limnoraphis robusta]MEA5497596.1 2-succinyl-5-enolpyruvyl-6-hydroxy-3-cyclohexene-1-carboxylic-acid synthase [Limnoraphis robusta BA-68 BA1]
MIDFRNTNTVWASILVETLHQLGLTTAIISPGSRSTPLTFAFAQHPNIESIPVLDERSAAFFALGIAKKLGLPTALVCTSGTAGANYYPAVIEARESRVPLLILTADRPPELRNCHAGQTIDQVKLYGNYPTWESELATPSLELQLLSYLRQTLIYAWERSQRPIPGAVHLNCPFRDPLIPVPQAAALELEATFPSDFFSTVSPEQPVNSTLNLNPYLEKWQSCKQGLIIAGVAQPQSPQLYSQAVAKLSQFLNWPVLAEGLSPVRNHAKINPNLISTYDLILRHQKHAQKLSFNTIIQVGDLPTSKQLRTWLEKLSPQTYIIDPTYQNLNSLHNSAIHLRYSIEQISDSLSNLKPKNTNKNYLKLWQDAEAIVRGEIEREMTSFEVLTEPKVSWLLPQILPPQTPIFISNSMPVRDVEFFWMPNALKIQPFFNRGANGIEGTLSTALGIAHHQQSSVLLTGDLALLHDTNGFLLRNKFIGHLTILLINNNGGGIFELLPIAEYNPPFEDFFATPQHIDFAQLCKTYSVDYQKIQTWHQLKQLLNPLPKQGIRVLEIPTNRKLDAQWRLNTLNKFAVNLES